MVRGFKESLPAMVLRRRACLFSAVALALTTPGVPAMAQQAGIAISGAVERPGTIAPDAIRGLPQQTLTVGYDTSNGPREGQFVGPNLWDVLRQAGMAGGRGDSLGLVVIARAADGYTIVFSGAELNPGIHRGTPVPILAHARQEAGGQQPLSGNEGPLRLVVPSDRIGGRYVLRVTGLHVIDARGQFPRE